ncbi:MAG: hypothetical protein ACREPG_07600 [Candidatus Binatia bacterium]
MRFPDIRRHLKAYSIVGGRTTTINGAFAAAIAPSDPFDATRVREALMVLGQNPDTELICVYCEAGAETWDHVHATVKNKAFSGYGHRIGNLLPCCKQCNSKKGNKNWRVFLAHMKMTDAKCLEKESRITAYIEKYGAKDIIPEHLAEYQELQQIRQQVLELLAKADHLAAVVRSKSN